MAVMFPFVLVDIQVQVRHIQIQQHVRNISNQLGIGSARSQRSLMVDYWQLGHNAGYHDTGTVMYFDIHLGYRKYGLRLILR